MAILVIADSEYASMQLSVLIPSHRSDLLTCSRIIQACSWAGPRLEVVIRDNSGDERKRNLLEQFRTEHCNIMFADPCGPMVNLSESLRLARGDFVFAIGDDDFVFDRATTAVLDNISQVINDGSIAGLTGTYLLEGSNDSSFLEYKSVDSNDPAVRISGYLKFGGMNLLYYSPIRRNILTRILSFIVEMPFFFSFHDQIICLLYLLNGRFFSIKRMLYAYDMGNWSTPEVGQKRDLDFYLSAGLDPAMNSLHWFICGFEGAVLIQKSSLFPDYSSSQRQNLANQWFSALFARFSGDSRVSNGAQYSAYADKLCNKWRVLPGRLSFKEILKDITSFISLSSAVGSQKYFEFWNSIIDKPVAPRPGNFTVRAQ